MNGLYVRADIDMIEATSSAISVAVPSRSTLHVRRGRSTRASRADSAGTHGADPSAPATSASHSSGVRYHHTVYGVGDAAVVPDIAFRNASAPGSVSARKNTQPTMTTASVYAWGQIGHAKTPDGGEVGDLVRWRVGDVEM